MSKKTTNPVEITSRWERPAVAIGKGETHLVVTIKAAKAKRGATRPPVDVAFVIDRSGSMSGQPLELAKRGVIDALDMLNDEDRFSVVAYDHTVSLVAPLMPATSANRTQIRRTLSEMPLGGSTNMYGGWQEGCEQLMHAGFAIAPGGPRRVRRTILLTDGLANVGVIDPQQISWNVARQRIHGIATSALGLGEGIDEAMLSGMVEAGGGNFGWVQHARDLPAFFARELGEALSVVVSEATLTLTLPKGIRAQLLNPFPVEREGKRITVALGDLPAGMTLDLVFSVTSRSKAEGLLAALDLQSRWIDVKAGTTDTVTVSVDPLMAVSAADFRSMPRDEKAAAVVAEMIAAEAKRQAIAHYRTGNRVAAKDALSGARLYAASAPMAREGLIDEINMMDQIDPDSANFEIQRRQIVNDEHRRSRGRDL